MSTNLRQHFEELSETNATAKAVLTAIDRDVGLQQQLSWRGLTWSGGAVVYEAEPDGEWFPAQLMPGQPHKMVKPIRWHGGHVLCEVRDPTVGVFLVNSAMVPENCRDQFSRIALNLYRSAAVEPPPPSQEEQPCRDQPIGFWSKITLLLTYRNLWS